jgi:predicted MFS family arabinose efflux permease
MLVTRQATGSFAPAGAVLAAYAIASALTAPAQGRAVDRRGAAATIPLLSAAATIAFAALLFAASHNAPAGVLVALAAVAGGASPPIIEVLRVVVSTALDDVVARRRAYSVLTLLQEAACVLGPALVGLLADVGSSSWALGTAAGLACLGAAGFALLPATAALGGSDAPAPMGDVPRRRLRVPRLPGMPTVLVVSAFCGVAFGGLDVAVPAFASAEGDVAAAGYLLAALAAGIGTGALLFAMRPPAERAHRIMAPLAVLAATGLAAPVLASSLVEMGVLLALAGACLAPTLTIQFAAVDEAAPGESGAEATAWVTSAFSAGTASGAALVGTVVDAGELRLTLAAGAIALALAALFALVLNRQCALPAAQVGPTRRTG